MSKLSKVVVTVSCLAAVSAAACAYVFAGQKYSSVYFPNTIINGVEASGMTVNQLKDRISENVSEHVIVVEALTGAESIVGKEIGLKPVFDEKLDQVLSAQKPITWGMHVFGEENMTFDLTAVCDENLLAQTVAKLECSNKENMYPEGDGKISDYIPGKGYEFIPGTPGTLIDSTALITALLNAVMNLDSTLNLSAPKVYATSDFNSRLQAQIDELNKTVGVKMVFRRDTLTEILTGDVVNSWILTDKKGGVSLNKKKITAYVKDVIAPKFDTGRKTWTFVTYTKDTVEITGGSYGWKVNQAKEVEAIMSALLAGRDTTREPVYSCRPLNGSDEVFGPTFVEVNLTAQHLYFYKDNEMILESDIVTGNAARKMSTPPGCFYIFYMKKDAVLRGPDYASPVSYWMPFNQGIGLHDAKWRKVFGGTIYQRGGSHGCVNLPLATAKTIFENVTVGIPVVCYHVGDGVPNISSSLPPSPKKKD